jgi:general stress protein 13
MDDFKSGDIVKGKITGIEDYGIFLSFGENSSGLIHISEISDHYIKNIYEYGKINEELSAKIISYEGNNHYKLSIKMMNEDDFNTLHFPSETKTGFQTLSENLDSWIEEAMEKVSKKSEKKSKKIDKSMIN